MTRRQHGGARPPLTLARACRRGEGARAYTMYCLGVVCFFFQAEDGIRDYKVTGVQTCALPILVYGLSVFFNGPLSDRIGGRKSFLFGAVGVTLMNFAFGIGTMLVTVPAVVEKGSEEGRGGEEGRSRWSPDP